MIGYFDDRLIRERSGLFEVDPSLVRPPATEEVDLISLLLRGPANRSISQMLLSTNCSYNGGN